jgi:type IV conjugative transfer system protein TraL
MEKMFPSYLSAPLAILWWDYDVFMLAIMMLILSLFIGGIFWLATIAVPLAYWYVQKGKPRGYLKHLYYAAGITTFKGYPNYFEREFHE